MLGGLLQILHQALVARVVGNHQLKIRVGLDQFALLVQWQGAAVVGQGVNDNRGILACLDHLVQIADRTDARRRGQRTVLPLGAVLVEQEAADQVRCRHVFVTGNRDQRLAQFPGHVFNKA